jgi:tetratricopeptide (TPR) repeat protein
MWSVTVRRIIASVLILTAAAAVSAGAQTDARLKSAVQLAAEGLPDSATAIVNGLLAITPVTDSLYPEILYTQGSIARTTTEMQRAFQKIAVEYPTSPWADDALLRLAQMDFAARNYAGTVRGAEQLRADNPSSSLIPAAAYWAARADFELGKVADGCAWISRGLESPSADVEAKNRLEFIQGRCVPGANDSGPPAPSPAAPPTPGSWGVQVAAVSSQASANSVLADLKSMGMTGTVLRESGNLYKVRVTGLASRDAAEAAAAAIKARLGGSPFVLVP